MTKQEAIRILDALKRKYFTDEEVYTALCIATRALENPWHDDGYPGVGKEVLVRTDYGKCWVAKLDDDNECLEWTDPDSGDYLGDVKEWMFIPD